MKSPRAMLVWTFVIPAALYTYWQRDAPNEEQLHRTLDEDYRRTVRQAKLNKTQIAAMVHQHRTGDAATEHKLEDLLKAGR